MEIRKYFINLFKCIKGKKIILYYFINEDYF